MTRPSPYQIVLTREQRRALEQTARTQAAAHRDVVRAKIVLFAADGWENKDIAARLDTSPQTVHRWRKRFYEEGLDGLEDRSRAGRPPVFPPSTVIAVKALACELPATSNTPLSRWSCSELAREAVDRGLVPAISPATVWRLLGEDAIRPWYVRSWIFPRDPDFAAKAGRVLDLYEGCFEGEPLGPGQFVILRG